MALTVARTVGCKQGWKEGGERGKVRFGLIDGRNWAVLQFSALNRKVYPYRLRDPFALTHPRFLDGSNVVPASVRLALRMLNRRADQQRLVDGVTQLNGGCGRAAQMSHRDGNDIGAGPA